MTDLMIGIVVGYILWQLIAGPFFIIVFGHNHDFTGIDFVILNPIQLYNNTGLNHFGAWFLAISACLILLPWAIPYWMYKLFTVGGQK